MQIGNPFTISTTDGFIIDARTLLRLLRMMQLSRSKLSIVYPTKCYPVTFVLDRGFRDAVPLHESKAYRVMMLSLKGKRKQQLKCTQEANEEEEEVHGTLPKLSPLGC